MFWNIYYKSILRGLRSKDMIIWTLLFPILLSTLFYFAFSGLDKAETLDTISVAVVEDEALGSEAYLKIMLEELSREEDSLLDITWTDAETADRLLKDGETEGFISVENGEPKLTVKEQGIYQTILKQLLDRYIQIKDSIQSVIYKNPQAGLQMLFQDTEKWMEDRSYIREVSLSGQEPSFTVNYYYALLAMVCLYGGFHGMVIVENLQANLSPRGARIAVAPVRKGMLYAASFLSELTTQFLCMAVVVCYMQFVLKISFGGRFVPVLAMCLVGSMAGIAFGALVSLPSRWKGGMKNAIVVCVSIVSSFLAGLMFFGTNYVVEQKLPLLAMLNPASRIADAFYSLYYYEDYSRYFKNMGILLIMTAVMLGVVLAFARRKQYESI
ncbi:MAG: ABC transporter permease [Eubacteriales bacterium]|nr:ABC transporter permease [Eubacteriales bacterium]